MKQAQINIYVIVSAALAIATTLLQIQPALTIINFLAPHPGDEYEVVFVLLVTFLIFLLPLLTYLIVARLIRKPSNEQTPMEHAGKTGVFITRQKSFSSAMVGVPVYVNDQKVGAVDNGKTVFYEVSKRGFAIHAGAGKQASEKLTVKIAEGEQLRFELFINTDGLFPKVELVEFEE